jgi:GNAT superfamily N-acetyltransferase
MQATIRRGNPTDCRAASDLYLAARKAALGAIPYPPRSDNEVHRWFASHVAEKCELWLAEDAAGELVGIMVLKDDWLEQLYIAPGYTTRGIGRTLLDVAKRERPGGLFLWTFQSNEGARRFYERQGFVEARRTDGRANEERAPDILYVYTA